MKTIAILLLLISVSSAFTSIFAQDLNKLPLEQAIQLAIDNNPAVRSAGYSVDVQKALKNASWDIPKTSFEGQYGRFNSYTIDNSFTISQSFSFPTVYIRQHQLALANVKSSEILLQSSRLEIATQVKQVYWQLSYLYTKQRLLIYQDSLYRGIMRAAKLRAESGETNNLKLITTRSRSMEIENHLQELRSDIQISTARLKSLLNAETEISITDTVLYKLPLFAEGDTLKLNENPSAAYMLQEVEISGFEKKLERNLILPEFSIGFFSQTIQGVQELNGIPFTFGLSDRFTGVQAGINIPIWFLPYTSRAKAAQLKELVSRTNAEYFTKSLAGNYESLIGEYSKFNNNVIYYEKQAIPEAGLIIEQATLSFRAGGLDYIDYMLNLDRALQIKQDYLDALNNCNQTVINIEFITGKIF